MTTPSIEVRRLGPLDAVLARHTLQLVADVFGESAGGLSERYVARLLAREDFWVVAALHAGAPVGGLTAHALPMTRDESTELFLYDLAVDESWQRQGIGRALVTALRSLAAAQGIHVTFVPADNDDGHALDFYRSLGGESAAVTIFTWQDGEE